MYGLLLILWIPRTTASSSSSPPSLEGRLLRITVLLEGGFLDRRFNDNGQPVYSGYIIDVVKALSQRANFTYELRTPSGKGSDCTPQITGDHQDDRLYHADYTNQYNCGSNDVNELPASDGQATDLYAGMFYISPPRQLKNRFTMPFSPPTKGTLVMYGTAMELDRIDDLVVAQREGRQPPACVFGSTANVEFLQQAFPGIQIAEFFGADGDVYQSMLSGECPIHIVDYPIATQFVLHQFEKDQCLGANQQPIGVIGEPMSFGLTHYAFGVRNELPLNVVETLSYWINILMTCNPQDPVGACPNGQGLAALYQNQGGTGKECGHVLYPPTTETKQDKVNVAVVTGVLVGSVGLILVVLTIAHVLRLKQQEQRYKRRFVEQIARNIEIGPSPGLITPEKLAQEIQHIAHGKGFICKQDLQQWMNDIKLTFLSERDFDALWDAMDIRRTDQVDPIEFLLFLSACGPQFEQVYHHHASLPKTERLKLAARRLSNFTALGEEGVRKIEHKLDRGSRELVPMAMTGAADNHKNNTMEGGLFGKPKRSGTNSLEQLINNNNNMTSRPRSLRRLFTARTVNTMTETQPSSSVVLPYKQDEDEPDASDVTEEDTTKELSDRQPHSVTTSLAYQSSRSDPPLSPSHFDEHEEEEEEEKQEEEEQKEEEEDDDDEENKDNPPVLPHEVSPTSR